MNPTNFIKNYMLRGLTPKGIVKQLAGNNPMLGNLINMAEKGDNQGIENFARNVLKSRGFGEYFTHSLGHGIGVKIHEAPRLSLKSDYVLKDGNVFSIEPGVYLNGKFGVRIEDTVALIDGKCVSMMTSDKNPIIL